MKKTTNHKIVNKKLNSTSLWYSAPYQVELKNQPLPDRCNSKHVRIKAKFSVISIGTERLVYTDLVPKSERNSMRCPFQVGDFPYPVKYGYSMVGKVIQSESNFLNQDVFVLHPHETLFDVPKESVILIPKKIPTKRAVLGANMETALNAVWDSNPLPGDQISVIGGGVVGSLVAYLTNKIPGTSVTLIDTNPNRKKLMQSLGLQFSQTYHSISNQDIVYNVTGNPKSLNHAIQIAGNEAKIIELSWYGTTESRINLGGAFHSKRLKILSSQVGQIAPERCPRWTNFRRLSTAIELLDDPKLDKLLTHTFPFQRIERDISSILTPENNILCPVIKY